MKKKPGSTASTCKNCQNRAQLHSGIACGKYYNGLCINCVGVLNSSHFARKYDRQSQRRHFAKDLIQPTEPGFARAYGEEAARKHGWTNEDLRKHG